MSTPARKRLMRDFKRLQQDPPAGISGAPQDNNIMLWNAVIFGSVHNLVHIGQAGSLLYKIAFSFCTSASLKRLLMVWYSSFLSM